MTSSLSLFKQLCLLGPVAFLATTSLQGIVFVSDQSFVLSDRSQVSETMRVGAIDQDFIIRDFLSHGTPSYSGVWTLKQVFYHPQVYYEVAIEGFPWAENLNYSSLIDDSLNWQDLSSPRLGINLLDYVKQEGGFFDTEGFLGIKMFSMDSLDAYYGWIRFDHNASESALTVHDWAWNSTAGEPIRAGEIPEPRTIALLTGIMALISVLGLKSLRSPFRRF